MRCFFLFPLLVLCSFVWLFVLHVSMYVCMHLFFILQYVLSCWFRCFVARLCLCASPFCIPFYSLLIFPSSPSFLASRFSQSRSYMYVCMYVCIYPLSPSHHLFTCTALLFFSPFLSIYLSLFVFSLRPRVISTSLSLFSLTYLPHKWWINHKKYQELQSPCVYV